jgi:hypothetical protein
VKTMVALWCVAVVCVAAWSADSVQRLDVKTGLWETTVTLDRSGPLPIPAELLAQLSPEQRAKLEEKMKAGPPGAKTTVHKHCLKKEDLDKPLAFGNDEKLSCNRTIVTSSRSKQEFHIACTSGGMKESGTVRIEALDSENVKGSSQMSVTNAARTMNVNATFSGKWIGACESKDQN